MSPLAQLWLTDEPLWHRVDKFLPPRLIAFVDRHYSRQTRGSRQIAPPGETLLMESADRYNDLEALHAELGEPYQSVTVKNLRDQLAAMTAARDEIYDLPSDHTHYDSPTQAARTIARAAELREVGAS